MTSLTWPSAGAAEHLSARPLVASRSLRERLAVGLGLPVLCGLLFFFGLDAGEFYRTESLRAIVAAEFLRTGDWVVPKLYGQALFTKPPGMYAAIALASWPGGAVTEVTARLPAAIAATVTVFLFFWYFRRQLGRPAGLVAAVVLPLSLMWLDKATAAEIDMLQVAWVTAAIVCFLHALEAMERTQSSFSREPRASADVYRQDPSALARGSRLNGGAWLWWLAALLCVAGGVLTKWTAPAFFYGTIVPLLWWRGRLRLLWCRQHLASAALGAGLCLTWAGLAIAREGWEPFLITVGREAMMHLSPAHHHRAYPWRETLLHPLRVWAAALPMSAFALPTLWPGFARLWDERGQRLLQVLHCWTWPNLLFWSVVPEHGTRQSFPLFPGLAGLAALVWIAWLTGRLPWRWRRVSPGKVLVGMVGVWLIVKVGFVYGVVPERNKHREPRAKSQQIGASVPAGETLYLFHLKDEGIMFYYGRTVRRLADPEQLPCTGKPLYAILEEPEWRELSRPHAVLLRLKDEQGAPLVLVRISP